MPFYLNFENISVEFRSISEKWITTLRNRQNSSLSIYQKLASANHFNANKHLHLKSYNEVN